jgi:hypothetical protein
MKFTCTYNHEEWIGKIQSVYNHGSHYEMKIESRSGITILFGKSNAGYFLSAPDYGVGCHLADLSDKFWNSEQLIRVLGPVDGITVAEALKQFSKTNN